MFSSNSSFCCCFSVRNNRKKKSWNEMEFHADQQLIASTQKWSTTGTERERAKNNPYDPYYVRVWWLWISVIVLSSPSCWFGKYRCTRHTYRPHGMVLVRTHIPKREKKWNRRKATQSKKEHDEQFYTENVSISGISLLNCPFSLRVFGCRSTI